MVAAAIDAVDVVVVCVDVVVVVVASVDVVDSPVLVEVGNADVSRTVVGCNRLINVLVEYCILCFLS